MADHQGAILIDKDLRPAYYDEFRCLMSACRLSCCRAGWHIGLSKKEYETLKRQKGSPDLNERLEHCVRRVKKGILAGEAYGEFVPRDGACPLWRDGICALQREKGEAAIPEVCRTFPRLEHYRYSGYLERYLGFGCEGVLALLWDLPEGVDFVSDPLPGDQRRVWEVPEGLSLLPWFQDIRSVCIDLLQDRRLPLPERIFIMGMALKDLADGEADIPRWLERTAALPGLVDTAGLLRRDRHTLLMFLAHNAKMIDLISKNGAVLPLLHTLGLERDPESGQITISGDPYRKALARFEETLGKREWFWENLMVSVFFSGRMPDCNSPELLWRSYVNYCNLYSIYRFFSVLSCREGAAGDRDELFRLLVLAGRAMIYNNKTLMSLGNTLYENDSATLAHMVILLSG